MRLASLTPSILRYPDANDFGRERMTVLLRAETVDGVVGWGEGIAMWPEACKATATIVSEGFAPLLLGRELSVAEAWATMKAQAWWYGEGGIAGFALSAIDMALWDIAGKIAGKPLVELLGGPRHASLKAIASCHVNKATLEACVAEVEGYFADGFRGVKLGFAKKGLSRVGFDPETDVRFVRMLRAALGADAEILVDAGNGVVWDRDTAISVVRRMAEENIGWIEEPFHPSRFDDHRALKAAVAVPIAAGEREWTLAGYTRMMEAGFVDVLGVDPARVEGVTGFRLVDAEATRRGVGVNAHAWSTAITTAASLHLSLASTQTRVFELKPHPVIVQTELAEAPIRHCDGSVFAPQGAGLGVTVREDVVARLRVGP
ncbi:MAG: mandelate racemase/muconate lactonizing enzyme family protein [Methylobacteriaceae bacterium]|nr:mandelate racemase/muconate lactonizing enzyme family protein [Methylobacteriaceae bacterium]